MMTLPLMFYIIPIPMVFGLGPWEIVIIALIFVLLFGGKKIPELMKGIGKGIKNFKDSSSGKEDADTQDKSDTK